MSIEGIVYIFNVSIKQNYLSISYFEKNDHKTLSINIKDCKTEIFGSSKGISHSSHICFFDKDRLLLKQYAIQDWTPEAMQEVAKKIEEAKKEYLSNKKDS